ncbi:hypothetical protein B0T17DRAFT_618896 [Bombardia bombarda]|uniref:Conidiation-specific protein 8 n=1 Tax=Bombardia bombarda TaxID=252184 RepID=A0AA39WN32_9PEZI|nr:hypothetical protein B0T17DRAFT_618896 [Bombardia bombarda]
MSDSSGTTTTTSSGFRNERSDSTSSTGSSGPGSPTSPRRASHGGLFEGLQAQKRKDDPASIARRQSMNEQRPRSGFIGQMWNNPFLEYETQSIALTIMTTIVE